MTEQEVRSLLARLSSLKNRIVFKFMLISTPFLLLISILLLTVTPYWYRQQAIQALDDKARSISLIAAHSLSPAVVFDDRNAIEEVFASLRQSPSVDYVLVFDGQGKEVARYLRNPGLKIYPDHIRKNGLLPSGQHLNQYQPILIEGRPAGYVAVGLSLSELDNQLRHMKQVLWISAAVIFLVGLAIIYFISRLISRPLRHMARTAREIAGGDYSKRAPVAGGDEIGVLAQSFNTMLDVLQSSLQKLGEARETLEIKVEERTRELKEQIDQKEAIAQKLKESEELFRNMVETLGEGVVIVDADENIIFANPAAHLIFNIYGGKLEGRNMREFTDRKQMELIRQQTLRRKQGYRDIYDLELSLPDGNTKTVIVNAAPRFDPNGGYVSTLAVMTEITERKKQELALAEAKQKLEEVVTELEKRNEQNRLLIEMGDHFQIAASDEEAIEVIKKFASKLFPNEGWLLYLRRAGGRFLQLTSFLEPPSEPAEILDIEDCWALRKSVPNFFCDPEKDLLCPHLKSYLPPELPASCFPLSTAGETFGLLVFFCCPEEKSRVKSQDQERRARQKKDLLLSFSQRVAMSLANIQLRQSLKEQSIRDPLTGLYNRRYLEETLERELARARRAGQPVSVIMVDLDRFKRINDSYGHEAGDYLLQMMARTLQRSVRAEDIVCRYGGEEFTIILPGLSLEKAVSRAQLTLDSVRHLELNYGGLIIKNISISAGVASCPEHGLNWPEVIQAADLALLRAKQEGRDRVVMAGKPGNEQGG
ncbi:MAG: diguanylate cyclase [Candidatus Saccharicenans sp.]|nr:diguanylate cyclase [Candidatus Saccharicenans sp.]